MKLRNLPRILASTLILTGVILLKSAVPVLADAEIPIDDFIEKVHE